jgi:hypothetical protein
MSGTLQQKRRSSRAFADVAGEKEAIKRIKSGAGGVSPSTPNPSQPHHQLFSS